MNVKFLVSKFLIALKILFLRFIQRHGFKDICFVTGQLEEEHYHAKTGKTTRRKYPVMLLSGLPFFNTVNNNLKYAIPALISTTGNTRWVGTNGLMTTADNVGHDGIVQLAAYGDFTPFTTTKDSGGTAAQNWVKWKGVFTAVGALTIARLDLGLNYSTGSFATPYLNQAVSKVLAINDVYTVYWTLTVA